MTTRYHRAAYVVFAILAVGKVAEWVWRSMQ